MPIVRIEDMENTQPKIRTIEDDLNDKILSLEKYVKLRLNIVEENMSAYNKLNICSQSLILILIMMLIVNILFGVSLITSIITILMLIPMIVIYCRMNRIKKESFERISKLKTEYEDFIKKHTY